MNKQLPALVISYAVILAITTLTLMQRVQPPTVVPIVCPTHTQPIPEKASKPTTEVEAAPDALNFDLPE